MIHNIMMAVRSCELNNRLTDIHTVDISFVFLERVTTEFAVIILNNLPLSYIYGIGYRSGTVTLLAL